MEKFKGYPPLIFGIGWLVFGIVVKQYWLSVVFGVIPILIFAMFVAEHFKDKKRLKKSEELIRFQKNKTYIISLGTYEKSSRCIYIDKNDNQIYDIWDTKVDVSTKTVTIFKEPPRKITFEEFVELADAKYPDIGAECEGINEDNWESYLGALQHWSKSLEKKKTPNCKDTVSLYIRYVFKSKNNTYSKKFAIDSLVSASQFLLDKGFVFKVAGTGGGVNEITHTGYKSYNVKYMDLENFRNNFYDDFREAEKNAMVEYVGWVTTLNYDYIYVLLEKDGCPVHIMADACSYRVVWENNCQKIGSIRKELNNEMLNILGDNYYLAEYD